MKTQDINSNSEECRFLTPPTSIQPEITVGLESLKKQMYSTLSLTLVGTCLIKPSYFAVAITLTACICLGLLLNLDAKMRALFQICMNCLRLQLEEPLHQRSHVYAPSLVEKDPLQAMTEVLVSMQNVKQLLINSANHAYEGLGPLQDESVYAQKYMQAKNHIIQQSIRLSALKAVKIDGMNLKTEGPFRDDKTIVMAALKTSKGKAIQFASPRLQRKYCVVKEAVALDGSNLQYLDKKWKNNGYTVYEAMNSDPSSYQYASERLKHSYSVIAFMLAKKNNLSLLSLVPPNRRTDPLVAHHITTL